MSKSKTRVTIAAVQMNSQADRDLNLERAEQWIHQAVDEGAQFIFLPEHFNYMGPQSRHSEVFEDRQGPTLQLMTSLAKKCGVWIQPGSFFLKSPGQDKRAWNTSVLITPDGDVLGDYHKMHLFDVEVTGDRVYRESTTAIKGEKPELLDTPWGPLGLSICYDLRFPELYRYLVNRGAKWFSIPSAFTIRTGKAHWKHLLRARAIENQAFVVAAAQCGVHSEGRETYGHSMVVDPWGRVIAELDSSEGVLKIELDFEVLSQVRKTLPALKHQRLSSIYQD